MLKSELVVTLTVLAVAKQGWILKQSKFVNDGVWSGLARLVEMAIKIVFGVEVSCVKATGKPYWPLVSGRVSRLKLERFEACLVSLLKEQKFTGVKVVMNLPAPKPVPKPIPKPVPVPVSSTREWASVSDDACDLRAVTQINNAVEGMDLGNMTPRQAFMAVVKVVGARGSHLSFSDGAMEALLHHVNGIKKA